MLSLLSVMLCVFAFSLCKYRLKIKLILSYPGIGSMITKDKNVTYTIVKYGETFYGRHTALT